MSCGSETSGEIRVEQRSQFSVVDCALSHLFLITLFHTLNKCSSANLALSVRPTAKSTQLGR